MERFIFDGKGKNLQKALEVQSRGCRVLCPKCQNELIRTTRGIYCPVSQKHISCFWTLVDEMLAFERFVNEMEEKKKKLQS